MANQVQPLTPAQAQGLAQVFHDVAAAIGAYRLAQVNTLTDSQQYQLQNQQLQCIQYSNAFVTAGLFAEQEDIAATLKTIMQQTTVAKQSITTINTVDKVLQIVTATAVLGASIASMNPAAVASGVQGLMTAVTGTAAAAGTTPTAPTSPTSQSSRTGVPDGKL
jgi:hypothetical protein